MAWYLEIGGYRGQAGDLNFRLKRFLVNVQLRRESVFHGLLSPKAFDEFMRREVGLPTAEVAFCLVARGRAVRASRSPVLAFLGGDRSAGWRPEGMDRE
jgi:hypothetical protein